MVLAGVTATDVPDPTAVPPQLPEYHSQLALVPRDPPKTVNVVDWPGQVGLTLIVPKVGAFEAAL